MKIIWFIRQSIILDLAFIRLSNCSLSKKIIFLYLKYFLIVRHFFVKFNLSESNINILGKDIYYDSVYGLAGYQSMLTRPKKLLNTAKIKNLKTAIDIGANVGFYSMMLHNYYPGINTYSFEPIPITFECLKKNLKSYQNAKYYNFGVADYVGKTKFSFNEQDSAISSISKNGNVEVSLVTIDNFISEIGIDSVDLLKIDTESYEHLVLKGATNTLKITKYLMIEVTMLNNRNYTFTDIMKLLNTKDYNFQLLALRNYSDKSEGETPILDMLLVNKKFI